MEISQIITVSIILLLLIGIICSVIYIKKLQEKETFVYPKTGHRYIPLYRCKLKCPSTGEWFDALIYQGLDDDKLYVRERKDFLDKFVKLKDWKNGNKSK